MFTNSASSPPTWLEAAPQAVPSWQRLAQCPPPAWCWLKRNGTPHAARLTQLCAREEGSALAQGATLHLTIHGPPWPDSQVKSFWCEAGSSRESRRVRVQGLGGHQERDQTKAPKEGLEGTASGQSVSREGQTLEDTHMWIWTP